MRNDGRERRNKKRAVRKREGRWEKTGQTSGRQTEQGVWKGRAPLREKRAERKGQQKRGDRAVCDCLCLSRSHQRERSGLREEAGTAMGALNDKPRGFPGALIMFLFLP